MRSVIPNGTTTVPPNAIATRSQIVGPRNSEPEMDPFREKRNQATIG